MTRSRGCVIARERVNVFVGNEIEQYYRDNIDRVSDKPGIIAKGIGFDV